MKREIMILFLIITPMTAVAEETTAIQTQARSAPGSYETGTAPSAGGKSSIEIYALIPHESGRAAFGDNGVIRDWRERVFRTLSQSSGPRPTEPGRDIRLLSHHDLAERSQEGRIILRTVLNETLKFTQERLPEIDRLVKAMRLEVSASLLSQESVTAETAAEKRSAASPVRRPSPDGLFIKTGLRVPVESGRLSILSETEATYGTLSTFFKIYVDGRYDNSVGVAYALAKDVRLKIEQHATHAASLGSAEGTTVLSRVSLVQFVCAF